MSRSIGMLLIFLSAPGVFSQTDAGWAILEFPAESTTLQSEIDARFRAGFVPLGIEIGPDGATTILVAQTPFNASSRWSIITYTDWNTLEDDIHREIDDGLVPMDISRTADSIAILWVDAELNVASWRLHAGTHSDEDRRRTITQLAAQGYCLWGYSVHDALAWYLFIQFEQGYTRSAVLGRTDDGSDALKGGVDEFVGNGWTPTAIGRWENATYVGLVQ